MTWNFEGGGNEDDTLSLHLRNEGSDTDTASFTIDRRAKTAKLVTSAGEREVSSIEDLDSILEADGLEPIGQQTRGYVQGALMALSWGREEA